MGISIVCHIIVIKVSLRVIKNLGLRIACTCETVETYGHTLYIHIIASCVT